jgi:hypothetical protein
MTSIAENVQKKEFDLRKESLKCLVALAGASLIVFAICAFQGSITTFVAMIFGFIFDFFDSALSLIPAALNSTPLEGVFKIIGKGLMSLMTFMLEWGGNSYWFIQPTLFFLGMWSSCVGIKICIAEHKNDAIKPISLAACSFGFYQLVFVVIDCMMLEKVFIRVGEWLIVYYMAIMIQFVSLIIFVHKYGKYKAKLGLEDSILSNFKVIIAFSKHHTK